MAKTTQDKNINSNPKPNVGNNQSPNANSNQKPNASSSSNMENYQKEWEKARDILKDFDERLHDLRKLGFSFLTVFLTVQAFLTTDIPDLAKLGVFTITLVLISALYLIDKNYVSFQEAANTRALVLERMMNLELSEIITLRYRTDGINRHVKVIYWIIIAGVLILGSFVFKDKLPYAPILAVLCIIAAGYIIWQDIISKFYHTYSDDWAFSSLRCTEKEPVTVMITNLKPRRKKVPPDDPDYKSYFENRNKDDVKDGLPKPIEYKKGDIIFSIINQTDFSENPVKAQADIRFYDFYSLKLTHENFPQEGFYKIRPRDRYVPLARVITVTHENSTDKKPNT